MLGIAPVKDQSLDLFRKWRFAAFDTASPRVTCVCHADLWSVVRTMTRSVTLVKGKNNMIGISIGGGVPFCPVLYVVQVSSKTTA